MDEYPVPPGWKLLAEGNNGEAIFALDEEHPLFTEWQKLIQQIPDLDPDQFNQAIQELTMMALAVADSFEIAAARAALEQQWQRDTP